MKSAIEQLMDATEVQECDRIVRHFEYKVPTCQLSRLYKFATHAKARIQRIKTESRKSFINQLN